MKPAPVDDDPRALRLFGAQVRLREPKALARVVRALQKHDGAVTYAAEELGVSVRAVYKWIDDVPELADHTRGRIGRPPVEKKKPRKRAA